MSYINEKRLRNLPLKRPALPTDKVPSKGILADFISQVGKVSGIARIAGNWRIEHAFHTECRVLAIGSATYIRRLVPSRNVVK